MCGLSRFAEFSQLPAPPSSGLSLLDSAHLALADVERVALYCREDILLKVLFELSKLPFEVPTRICLAVAPTVISVSAEVIPPLVCALSSQVPHTSSLRVVPGSAGSACR